MVPSLPTGATVADLLLGSRQTRSYYDRRLVERFRLLGMDRWGLWFDHKLSLSPEELDAGDVLWITKTWEQFIAGEQPFRRRPHVTT